MPLTQPGVGACRAHGKLPHPVLPSLKLHWAFALSDRPLASTLSTSCPYMLPRPETLHLGTTIHVQQVDTSTVPSIGLTISSRPGIPTRGPSSKPLKSVLRPPSLPQADCVSVVFVKDPHSQAIDLYAATATKALRASGSGQPSPSTRRATPVAPRVKPVPSPIPHEQARIAAVFPDHHHEPGCVVGDWFLFRTL